MVLQHFSEKERKSLSEKNDGKKQIAPNEASVGYLPIIHRGIDYSPYYMTSGRRLTL